MGAAKPPERFDGGHGALGAAADMMGRFSRDWTVIPGDRRHLPYFFWVSAFAVSPACACKFCWRARMVLGRAWAV
jgi:hypothetical protein